MGLAATLRAALIPTPMQNIFPSDSADTANTAGGMNDITVRRPVQWRSAAATHVGTVRAMNEDAVLARPEIGLWAVADGMGGHDAGNVASAMIVEFLAAVQKPTTLSQFVTAVEDCVLRANERLREYSEIMLDGRTVGSTFVCLLIYQQVGVCLWTGDSRLYRCRGPELMQLSRDHSEVAELLRAGAITAEEAVGHPDANIITRAVGTGSELYIDIDVFDAQLGDTFLLCSDGLYNAIDAEAIVSCLHRSSADDVVAGLLAGALDNGASDNVSAIVVKGTRRQPTAVTT